MRCALVNFDKGFPEVLEAFQDALEYKELKYGVSALYAYGFSDYDITRAIHRAIQVCKTQDINPRRHIRYYYKVEMPSRQTAREWRMSETGIFLVLCNGDPENPNVGAFQLMLLKSLRFGKFPS